MEANKRIEHLKKSMQEKHDTLKQLKGERSSPIDEESLLEIKILHLSHLIKQDENEISYLEELVKRRQHNEHMDTMLREMILCEQKSKSLGLPQEERDIAVKRVAQLKTQLEEFLGRTLF